MDNNKADEIRRLKSYITNNSTQISNLSNSVTRMEREHYSLVQFRRSVVSTQENVNRITHNQNQYLAHVKSISNNRSVRIYGNGMSKTLSGFGTKVVGLALVGLILKIDLKTKIKPIAGDLKTSYSFVKSASSSFVSDSKKLRIKLISWIVIGQAFLLYLIT